MLDILVGLNCLNMDVSSVFLWTCSQLISKLQSVWDKRVNYTTGTKPRTTTPSGSKAKALPYGDQTQNNSTAVFVGFLQLRNLRTCTKDQRNHGRSVWTDPLYFALLFSGFSSLSICVLPALSRHPHPTPRDELLHVIFCVHGTLDENMANSVLYRHGKWTGIGCKFCNISHVE